jgi:hypothetical protein
MDLGVLHEVDKENEDMDGSEFYKKKLDEGQQF